jgi:hypothetical protein
MLLLLLQIAAWHAPIDNELREGLPVATCAKLFPNDAKHRRACPLVRELSPETTRAGNYCMDLEATAKRHGRHLRGRIDLTAPNAEPITCEFTPPAH